MPLNDNSDSPKPPADNGVGASTRRIAVATLVAIPATAALTGLLLLVQAQICFVVAICGLVAFYFGKSVNRPLLVGVGGVAMFSGIFAWALQQPV